ncbi:hypothetical protein O6H91_08G111300 [Diphasiastrum complanatum]|uniref:Uncharacterized protein n=1 Tax=Diphasiastrum complanatum TaxID=34168 RepID=A0ACC2D137_DIPCM|nr:hypothetical protein O6H91_08G111300 [Diphasiastrum complanatum]
MPWLAFPPPSLASLLLPPSPLRPRLASAMAARRAFLRSITSKLPITSSSGTRNWLTPALGSHHRPDAYDQRDRFGRSSRVGDRVGQLQQWKGQQIREYQDCGLQVDEARRLLKQVNMESLRKQLHANGHKEFVTYEDLVHLCRQTGVAASEEAAERFVQALDEAGVVLIFRGKVFLHPEEIAEKVADVLPSLLLFEDDGHKQEFELLQKELEDIDTKASR